MARYMTKFSMYADVKFDYPVKDISQIYPGDYRFVMKGESIHFGFESFNCYVDMVDSRLVHMEMLFPDFQNYPDMYKITPSLLRNVTKISEFFVEMHEDAEFYPVSLEECHFYLWDGDKETEINIKDSILKKAMF